MTTAEGEERKCKCYKTGTFVTFTGDCPIHAPTPEKQEDWEKHQLLPDAPELAIVQLVRRSHSAAECKHTGNCLNESEMIKKLTVFISTLLSEEREKNLEALKLWRPYFYRDKITDEDIAELPAIFGLTNSHQKE